MTAQIPDFVNYEGQEYSIAGTKGKGLFMPASFGMKATMIHTGCYRGFYTTYEVANGKLYLTAMTLRAEDGDYQPIGDVMPVRNDGHHVYEYPGLRLLTPYTGGLLIGRDLAMYVHMGFHKPVQYNEVIELTLDNGKVTSAVDLSERLAQLRDEMVAMQNQNRGFDAPPRDMGEVQKWIEWRFSLDYDL